MKTMIFHIMRTFRWLIVTASKVLSALMVLVLIIAMFSDAPTQTSNLIMAFVFAVLFGSVSWYYDVLLKKLEPQNKSNQEWS